MEDRAATFDQAAVGFTAGCKLAEAHAREIRVGVDLPVTAELAWRAAVHKADYVLQRVIKKKADFVRDAVPCTPLLQLAQQGIEAFTSAIPQGGKKILHVFLLQLAPEQTGAVHQNQRVRPVPAEDFRPYAVPAERLVVNGQKPRKMSGGFFPYRNHICGFYARQRRGAVAGEHGIKLARGHGFSPFQFANRIPSQSANTRTVSVSRKRKTKITGTRKLL
jgi:hypothetical protein